MRRTPICCFRICSGKLLLPDDARAAPQKSTLISSGEARLGLGLGLADVLRLASSLRCAPNVNVLETSRRRGQRAAKQSFGLNTCPSRCD